MNKLNPNMKKHVQRYFPPTISLVQEIELIYDLKHLAVSKFLQKNNPFQLFNLSASVQIYFCFKQ